MSFTRPLARHAHWILFAALTLIYNLNGRFIAGSDVYSTRFMCVVLAKNFSYYLPDPAEKKPWNLGTIVEDPKSPSNNKAISVYPTYMPTLCLPIYLFFYRILGLAPEHYLTFYLDKWISTLIAAGTGALTFSLIRRLHGGKIGLALLTTLGMSLGTSIWAITSQGSWAMGPSAFFLILSVWALERAVRLLDEPGTKRWAVLAGWAIASAFAMRLTNIFFVLPFFFFGLWEMRRSPKANVLFMAGIAPVALWFVIHNMVYFGSPLKTGYFYNLDQLRTPNLMHIENFFSGFFGLLFSPSLGMFMTGPVTVFAIPGIFGLFRVKRKRIEKKEDGTIIEARPPVEFLQRIIRLAAIFLVIHILFYSCYLEWWAGWSYCYRYLIDIQPFIALCTGWFFRPEARWRSLRWPLFIPAFLFSFFIQYWGAFFWNGQFFALRSAQGLPITSFKAEARLYLNLDPNKGHPGVMNRPTFLFSMKKNEHIVLMELQGGFPSGQTFRDSFATFGKIRKDLFETKLVPDLTKNNFAPIIMYYGR